MFTRTFDALGALLLLTACGQGGDGPSGSGGLKVAGNGVACAPAGATTFNPDCSVDRTPTQDGMILTIRHPDGGFRRLRVTRDGRGVVAADGAEPAKVTIIGPREIEVALGGDRYRLPATLGRAPEETP